MKIIKENEVRSLIERVNKDNCEESFCRLSELYESFYFKISIKYSAALYKIGMSTEEIASEKNLVLLKAIQTFNAKQKTKFSTWFCNSSKYYFLNLINSNKKHIAYPKVPIETANNADLIFTVDKNKDTYNYLMSLLGSFKDPRVKQIYELRYFSGGRKPTTWSAIGKKIGISTQTAINLHEKTKSFLKAKIKSNNFFDFV